MTAFGLEATSSYLDLPEVFFTKVAPEPVSSPKIVIFNHELADNLDLKLTDLEEGKLTKILSGNLVPKGVTPFAQAYAGHQFGHFTMLGDGRAVVLGEILTSSGSRYDVQFKGSGKTPYSRGGDGRAALGPMLREYIISEAMHFLGIPTTRSLAVVSTGEIVYRENQLPGAILTRVASSHLRVGTFEYASLHQSEAIMQSLFDYLVDRHFPSVKDEKNPAIAVLDQIIQQQTDLITNWMRVGFIHGVMNTDNMALSGETIDYGPCAFMDHFDPQTVFSSIDRNGRYAYSNQPYIGQWNLARLAQSLLPLIDQNEEKAIEIAEHSLNSFEGIYKRKWLSIMGNKLGFTKTDKEIEKLVTGLLDWMHQNSADFTNTFRDLCQPALPSNELYKTKSFVEWHDRWKELLTKKEQNLSDSLDLMRRVNPNIIPRNHKVEEALVAAEKGDLTPFNQILGAIEKPYHENNAFEAYRLPPEEGERVLATFCGT